MKPTLRSAAKACVAASAMAYKQRREDSFFIVQIV